MKEYKTPVAEKVVFDYSDNVVASSGHKYRLYTDGYFGCRETPTDVWVNGDMSTNCNWT